MNYQSTGSVRQFDSFPNFLIVLGTGNCDVVLQWAEVKKVLALEFEGKEKIMSKKEKKSILFPLKHSKELQGQGSFRLGI